MKAFRYNTQTCVYYGRNSIAGHQDIFKEYGKKAVVVSSKFVKGCPNYARDDLKEIFRKLDMEFIILEDVVEDPPVENIVAMYEKLDGFTPDFLVGAGGGAALDAAKALAMLIGNPGKDPYDIFYGAGAPMNNFKNICDIPVFSVPTTAGTGSEVTGGAVLTRKDKQTKEAMYMWYYPEISFVDPRYIERAPLFLLDTGAIDALAHGVECSIHKDANVLNRGIARTGFELFAQFKDNLLKGTLEAEDFDKLSLAAFTQGIAFMQSCTTIPHGLGYPLSHFKNVCHGLACGIFLGEYVKAFRNQAVIQPIVEACGFKDAAEFAGYVQQITNRDVDIEVTEEEIVKWTDMFMEQQQWRLEANPEKFDWNDIYNMYEASLKKYIVAETKHTGGIENE